MNSPSKARFYKPTQREWIWVVFFCLTFPAWLALCLLWIRPFVFKALGVGIADWVYPIIFTAPLLIVPSLAVYIYDRVSWKNKKP